MCFCELRISLWSLIPVLELLSLSVPQAAALKKSILEFSGFVWANEVCLSPTLPPQLCKYAVGPFCSPDHPSFLICVSKCLEAVDEWKG